MKKIPKILHYCWFGRGEKPQDIQEYIAEWKKKLNDYEFMEWNEDSFIIEQANDYVKEAYAAKKYAFVSDYVRLKVLYEHGGIYLDTDVEVKKPFQSLIENQSMVLGFESDKSLLTAFIAVEKNHFIIKEFMESYEGRHFKDALGLCDFTTINDGFSRLMQKYGVDLEQNIYQEINDIKVYPVEYFCGFDVKNWHTKITENTYMVHHMASSWVQGNKGIKLKIIKALQTIIGIDNYDKLKKRVKKNVSSKGLL